MKRALSKLNEDILLKDCSLTKRILRPMNHFFTFTVWTILLAAAASGANETKKAALDPNAWRERLPVEVSNKLPNDMSALLAELGYDSRPKERSAPVRVWGNDFSNFDNDDTNDWIVHVMTTDFRGKAVAGTLVYDRAEHGWTCIAKLPGTFPINWGTAFEGRSGIRTLEGVPEDSPSTQMERYYRWNGTRYIPDRIEFARGG
jgi:hypothetical protein